MKFELKDMINKGLKNKFVKIIGVVIVVVIVVVVGKKAVSNSKLATSVKASDQNIAIVKKGNITTQVEGAGPIYFTKSNKINSRVGGKITKINFKVGDKVKSGDVIYELDDKDAKTSVDIVKQALKQSQVTSDASNEATSDLSISAPFNGQVKSIAVNVGDTVAAGGVVLTITDTSKLKVLLSFNAKDVGQISIGQAAKVNITSMTQAVEGNVSYISNQPSSTISGGQIYTVEIVINNPGALLGGMTASADIKTSKGSVSSANTASMNYINKQAVISKTGGTVQAISVKEDQKVNSGASLVQMKNDSIVRAQETTNIGMETTQDQINLATSQLDYYKITSPISGVLSTVNFQVGDTINAGVEVSEVLNQNNMKFDIPVDEIDIAKIVPGQLASITAESIPSTLNTPVKGEVETVASKGTSLNGVTSYLVTIRVKSNFNLFKGGMNVNASVQVINKPNVLYVPINAITNGNGSSYVLLKDNKGIHTEVELGVKNDKYVEIKSGLIAGDQVILTQTYASTAN
ncbi:efflux RND transporter periplasmic adaptor subunit [Clostridium estertheticum]|uniref:efflux RND transporter periplasmic adaptor subunit n=1 Tax=Clostridium estertheticum TaxID=238834 RepID=UPI001C7D9469|nr:efflux RND transporter periplasmic adaptor subunit [Clostridium estertheticum]MBX4263998.1 efflux RND transporter periplasmic adaptor subunit [Clostridium estertheticum]MBX4268066.1 efflux RND transporter periplasmic adaptor subunit [Clostridium estertheticum]WLC79999.1 efflux RND transporter periplasmic adaptor subunit [Clostridium estertheticum]WLC87108.1 efflux RND transporter periplasmic adaptor subunit [Clostridium estertheticum]